MHRRDFLESLSAAATGVGLSLATTHRAMAAEPSHGTPETWRRQFPALGQRVNGHPLVYLDTAATALRPTPVIDAIAEFYRGPNANPGATLHTLAKRAAGLYDDARRVAADFIGARDPLEVVFTRGTTEALNLVATAWCATNLRAGDEILIGRAEHSSNMLPWQLAARRANASLQYFDVDDAGHARLDDLDARLSPRTRVVAFSHVSNVLGMINPAKEMCARARGPNRIVVVDGAQSVPHFAVNVRDLGCDFLAFSSHKMLGPMGVGILWGRRELLESMSPYQAGSNMAHDVDLDSAHYSEGALKFGAGTPNVSGPIGLAAAMRFILAIGHDAMWEHEQSLTTHMIERLSRIRRVRLLGSRDTREKISVFAFTVEGSAPGDVLRYMDARGIAIRAGDLASLPLLKRLGTATAARASCYLYTSLEDVDRFADALESL